MDPWTDRAWPGVLPEAGQPLCGAADCVVRTRATSLGGRLGTAGTGFVPGVLG